MRRWMMVVALAATAAALISVPARAEGAVPEVQSCSARPELGLGSQGNDVRCLQYVLIMLGYPVGYTGTFDQRTSDAVRSYQNAHPPLNPDGIAGEHTLQSLGIRSGLNTVPVAVQSAPAGASASPVAQREENELELPSSSLTCLADAEQVTGSRGQSVTCLQSRLIELGMFSGRVTGEFDDALAVAVKSFQTSRPPLNVDGKAGPRTLAAMGIWSGISPRPPAGPAGPAGPGGATAPIGTGPFPAGIQPQKSWNLTADGIPFYANHVACTPTDAAYIANEFAIDGADVATQQWAVYIASREGGCRFDAVNINPKTRDDSHCTFQLNALSGAFEPHGELGRRGWTTQNVKSSIQACADAASDLWVFCGRGPWTPPYACRPPWVGAASGQVPANIPVESTIPPTVSPTILSEAPVVVPTVSTISGAPPTLAPATLAPATPIGTPGPQPNPPVVAEPPTGTTTTAPAGD